MSSNSDVFQRKPFKSGDSKVITVTGLPLFSSTDTLNMKPMQLNGKDCIILSSYKEMSLAYVEDLPDSIDLETGEGLEILATHGTVYGLAQKLSEMDIDVSDDEELVLSKRKR